VYQRAVPFPVIAYHDEWLALVSLICGKISPLPRTLMKYRQDRNALGGLPVSFRMKVLNWTKNIVDKSNLDIAALEKKYDVLSAFQERYGNSSQEFVRNLPQYLDFLSHRTRNLQERKFPSLQSVGKYCRYYSPFTQALRVFSRDIVETLVGKILRH
jgi:hypothetical protein